MGYLKHGGNAMELLWIIFITALAVTAAYYAGGFLDRRAREQQQAQERIHREESLAQLAAFVRGFAGLLVRRGLAGQDSAPEISCLLSRYIAGFSEEGYTQEEWARLEAQLCAPEKEEPK